MFSPKTAIATAFINSVAGSEYDKDGNMRKWWSKDVKAKYVEKTKCILKQYNAYYVPQIKMHVSSKSSKSLRRLVLVNARRLHYAHCSATARELWEKISPISAD